MGMIAVGTGAMKKALPRGGEPGSSSAAPRGQFEERDRAKGRGALERPGQKLVLLGLQATQLGGLPAVREGQPAQPRGLSSSGEEQLRGTQSESTVAWGGLMGSLGGFASVMQSTMPRMHLFELLEPVLAVMRLAPQCTQVDLLVAPGVSE